MGDGAESDQEIWPISLIQHNPLVADGPQPFIDYFTAMADQYPGKQIEFVRGVVEGDLVALHTHPTWPAGDEYVTMDFFRSTTTARSSNTGTPSSKSRPN